MLVFLLWLGISIFARVQVVGRICVCNWVGVKLGLATSLTLA